MAMAATAIPRTVPTGPEFGRKVVPGIKKAPHPIPHPKESPQASTELRYLGKEYPESVDDSFSLIPCPMINNSFDENRRKNHPYMYFHLSESTDNYKYTTGIQAESIPVYMPNSARVLI
jgi:hypothetical protein